MKSLKIFCATLTLIAALSLTAVGQTTPGQVDTPPGQVDTPPAATSTSPGQVDTPPASNSTTDPLMEITADVIWSLLTII